MARKEKDKKLMDRFGRAVHHLRLSVTDRCNLRCQYCQPPQGIEYYQRSQLCSFEEFLLIAETASELGIDKIRLTGGEVFLRKDILAFMRSLFAMKRFEEIVLTTNGTLVLPHLHELVKTGIRRLNISLDTLSPDLFTRITGQKSFFRVLEGIQKASEEGLRIKINMVVLNGVNSGEIPSFIRYFLGMSAEVRFIEFMPLCGSGWREDYFFPYKKILEVIQQNFCVQPITISSGVAEEFLLDDGNGLAGKIGIIAPVSHPFCSSCSRIRLTATGEVKTCLFSNRKVELLPVLRGDFRPAEKKKKIRQAFIQAVQMKPFQYGKNHTDSKVYIGRVGG